MVLLETGYRLLIGKVKHQIPRNSSDQYVELGNHEKQDEAVCSQVPEALQHGGRDGF